MVKALVTGASGFVGRCFVANVPADWQITYLGRSQITESSARHIACDLTDASSVRLAAESLANERFDALLHLAAFVPKVATEDTMTDAIRGNITATAHLLEYFGGLVPKIVLGSTAEVYDQTKINGVITEDNPIGASSYYGATKLGSEFLAQFYCKKHNKEVTILRFSVMYGGYDPIARALPNFIRAAKSGEMLTVRGAKVLRDYIHTTDVAQSAVCAILSPGAGVVNIGTGRGVTIEAAAHFIIDASQSTSQVTIESQQGGVDIVMNTSKAHDLLGYTPKMIFPDGLKEMIALYD